MYLIMHTKMDRSQKLRILDFARITSFILIFSIVLTSAEGVFAATKKVQGLRLSNLLNDENTTGYLQEPEEVRKQVQNQIEEFRAVLEENSTDEQLSKLKDTCDRATPEYKETHPLCRIIPFYIRKERAARRARRKLARVSSKRSDLEKTFKTGDDRYFYTHLSEVKWFYAKLRDSKGLDSYLDRLLGRSFCPPSSFLLTLGLQMEADLPDPKIQKIIGQVYSKATKCGQDIASLQASYRLGLLQIFNGKCSEAEETLSKIPDTPQAPDYRVRIGYWRYYCSRQSNNTPLSDKLRTWLLREYPLSLHTLLAYSDRSLEKDLQFQKIANPEVHLRSEGDPGLANFTRMVEGLIENQMLKPAGLLLETQISRVQLREPEFQWYWLVLLKRAGNRPASFSLLASLFRSRPEFIATDTLGLMYPFEYFSLVDELRENFDPYLILSLIRQESAFDTTARSAAGARGLMQLQPATAHHVGRVNANQLYNPRTNIRLGVKYLGQLVRQFADEKELSLAAYNAGPNKIKYWLQRFPTENRLLFLDLLPLRETRDYVTSIARNYFWYKKLYAPHSKMDFQIPLLSKMTGEGDKKDQANEPEVELHRTD